VIFKNRNTAGKELAKKIKFLPGDKKIIVLGIPRGGVVVAKEIADLLKVPLDIIVAKKIAAPHHSELAIGAVGTIGQAVIDEKMAAKMGADEQYINSQIKEVRNLVAGKEKELRGGKPPLELKDKAVILVDDGVATGATMAAAIGIIRQSNPYQVIVAVPVIAKDTLSKIENSADEVIYLQAPMLFFAVGQFYQDFTQVNDKQVKQLLK